MKVAYLLGSINRGGAETLALDVANNSLASEIDFIFIHRKNGSLKSEFQTTGKTLIKITPNHKFDILYVLRLRKFLKTHKINIVHTHQVIDTFYSYLATLGTSIKLVFTLHGHGINDGAFNKILRKLALKKSDKNLYVSKSLMDFYKKKFRFQNGFKHQVCYNGISFKKFGQNLKGDLTSINKRIKMAMIGNFTSVRNQATICRFLNLLDENKIDFEFLFVGAKSKSEPWLYNNCIQQTKHLVQNKKVEFTGSRQDVPHILNQLDAFIYSSAHDTFGIAVIEAMYTGIPVFLNDWEVMKEITDNGKYATIFRSKDEKNLLQKFTHFLENSDNYRMKAVLAKEFVEKNYSIQSHLLHLKKIYQSVVKT